MHDVMTAIRKSGLVSDDDFEWLYENGKGYRGRRLPDGIRRQASGQCLDVADQLEREGLGRYVRGFALNPSGKLFGHAWVTGDGSTAIDATWPSPQSYSYFGVKGRSFEGKLSRISRPFMAKSLFSVW